jgi:cell division protease FtsH
MNEAALLAARRDLERIGHAELEAAIDRVLAGPERKSRVMSEQEKLTIAYHEGGHALVGHVLQGTDPIHKVSIVARGRALGWTLALPLEDKYLHTRSELEDSMAMLLGGRTAEELVFSEITTGASDDIERCTDIARGMVTQYGMSDLLGPQQLGKVKGEIFLGRDFGHEADYSPEVAAVVDGEVRSLIDTAHDRARAILEAHRSTLDHLASSLVEKETLEDADLALIFGEVDKGSGIELPEPRPTDEPAPIGPELVGVASGAVVVEQAEAPESAAAPAPQPAPAPPRRWWRRLGVRAPRPSGT